MKRILLSLVALGALACSAAPAFADWPGFRRTVETREVVHTVRRPVIVEPCRTVVERTHVHVFREPRPLVVHHDVCHFGWRICR
jgi:hypothetical protein